MNQNLTTLLENGYSLLTPTMRMSRVLNNQYANFRMNSGALAWESADILPWQTWLNRFWENRSIGSSNIPVYLNTAQQLSVWLQIIENPTYAEHILQAQNVARQAMQAFELSHLWNIPLFPEDVYINHDVRAFQIWANEYLSQCQRNNWIDDARLPEFLIKGLQQDKSTIDMKIAIVGHDKLLPQQIALLDALRQNGAEVIIEKAGSRNNSVRTLSFIDSEEEIRAAAEWAAKIVEEDSATSVGIIVPDLQAKRTLIEDGFDDVLAAADILLAAEPESKVYSISLGQPLSSYSVIATALAILELVRQSADYDDISKVLLSPYITGAHKEASRRAQLDAVLREFGEEKISVQHLVFLSEGYITEHNRSDDFLACLQALSLLTNDLPRVQSRHEWAQVMRDCLAVFAWPGERSLNSAEYQTIEAWQKLMSQFVSLDGVCAAGSFSAALSQLRQLSQTASFQPETSESSIQLMGHAGAAGMEFEHLWVLGLHEEAWPGPIKANPFIPLTLQKEHNLPAASAESQFEYAREISAALIASSVNTIFSYPRNEADRNLKPSSLIRPYINESGLSACDVGPHYSQLIHDSQLIEEFNDDNAPALAAGLYSGGGSALFKDQAACSFRAFAKHRLHARSLAEVDIGLNALERGLIVHELMQNFWSSVQTSAQLQSLSSEQETKLVRAAIRKALIPWRRQKPETFTDRFTQLEEQRLQSLASERLALEKKRDDFRVVAREEKRELSLADIEIRTRIDRVDEISGSRQVIIDYKTGNASVSAWFDERPEDPQLPLYTICSDRDIAAIAFASVKPGNPRFIGVSTEEHILPDVKPLAKLKYRAGDDDWDALLSEWRAILTGIGTQFRQGDARVNPKNQNTCRYCDLHAFCRVHEIKPLIVEEAIDSNE